MMHVFTSVAAEFASGLPGSKARCKVAPSSQQIFSIKKGGVEVGTMTFAASANVPTFAAPSDFTCGSDEYLEVVAPASVDVNIEDIAVTLKGDKQDLFVTTTTAPPPGATTTTTTV
jgi:hypothetical protein